MHIISAHLLLLLVFIGTGVIKGKDEGKKSEGFLPNQVDQNEIIRRGEWVEKVGEIKSDQLHSIEAAFATPPDDSYKWYISVICSKGCKYCEKLKYDFEHDDTLQSWVNVNDNAKSWAHYQVYQWEDETQKPRFEKIRIKGFPTLLIQPPRNGTFGSSATVVWQKTGYDGNTEKLSREMSNAIKRYVAAVNDDRQKNPREELQAESTTSDTVLNPDEKAKFSATPETEDMRAGGAVPYSDTIGVEPPFSIPNRDEIPGRNHEIPPEVTGVLTEHELRELLPNADNSFIVEMLKLGVNREEALRRFSIHKESFSWSGIAYYFILAFVALVVFVGFIVFVVIAVIAVKFASSRIVPNKPVRREEVIHKEVIHDLPSDLSSNNEVIKLKKQLATLQSKQQQYGQQGSDL